MAKDIGSYFLEQGQPIVPKAKPKQYTIAKEKSQTEEVLDILNTKAAATMLSPRTYTNLVGQTARKAYDQQDISASDYYDIVMPLFGETGEMVTEKIRQYDAELDRYADGGRIGFYKGSSAVKSHGAEIKRLTEAGESSVTIAKKLGLAQQTVNAAMDAMDKGIAGEEFQLSKPRSEIIKQAVNQTGVNLKDPKHVEEVIQWIDDNPKANQKDAIKIFGKRKAQLVNSKFYGSPGKKWNNEKVKLKNKARLELTKLRSSPSLEAELGAPKKSGLNFHHAGFKESLTDLKNTMYIPGSPNRKMAKLFEDPLLKEMEAFTKVFDNVDASDLEKQKAATNYLKNDRALRQKYPEFKDFKTRLSFRRTSLDPSGIMFKEKLPDPSLAISNEPGMTLKGETPSTNKGKEIIKKATEKYGKYAKAIARPVFRAAAPFIPFVGTAGMVMGGADVAKASEFTQKPDELAAAYLFGPEGAKGLASLKNKVRGKSDEFEEFVP
jgi:DNA-binding NarL/FixJ family response regulator